MRREQITTLVFSTALALVLPATARGDVIAVGQGAFPGFATLITFTGLPDQTEVNGLNFGGVQFAYSLGSGNVVIDGGPGATLNIAPPNIVSIGNNTGVLSMILPSLETMFGFGFAVLNTVPVANATTITLFNGVTNVGSLSFNGVPDPTFAGGFAGILSTIPFDRVNVTFNSVAAPAFALDNIRFANVPTAVPEPTTITLVAIGLLSVGWSSRRRRN